MEFKILKKSKKSRARLGLIKTSHGVLHTPCFLPVATQGTVKALTTRDIKEIGFEGVLCNTYHLFLRPGDKLIRRNYGGLHKFMDFQGVIVTDSGGFQVFSLGKAIEQGIGKIAKMFPEEGRITPRNKPLEKESFVKIKEEGVYFKSHLDGKEYFLTPEKSIEIQKNLGADIIFSFDECTSPFDDFRYTKKAVERTHRWALRCLKKAGQLKKQALFGIVQGGDFKQLRQESAKFISSLPFSGFGIGGPLGRTKEKMLEILDWVIPLLPPQKPRHLLGIGYLEDIKEAVKRGVDMFDCVYPTRFARHGIALTKQNKLDLRRSAFLKDKAPLDKNCGCFVCQTYSRGYISHLLRAKEMTALSLLTYHNLWFFKSFLSQIREDIKKGKL
jgi:queuine tRNA-ribosyltransferase/7-cyano-7-deazaguanine tRNA-ribosyltransferase